MVSPTLLTLACAAAFICKASAQASERERREGRCRSFFEMSDNDYSILVHGLDTLDAQFREPPEVCVEAGVVECMGNGGEEGWFGTGGPAGWIVYLDCQAEWLCERATPQVCTELEKLRAIGQGMESTEPEMLERWQCAACDGGIPDVFFVLAAVAVASSTLAASVGASALPHSSPPLDGSVSPDEAGAPDESEDQDQDQDQDSDEEKEEISERRSLSGLKEGHAPELASEGGAWVISPARATLQSFMREAARLAWPWGKLCLPPPLPLPLPLPAAQPSNPDPNLVIRTAAGKAGKLAQLLPSALLALPCWGGALWRREGARAKWTGAAQDTQTTQTTQNTNTNAWLIPVSSKEVWWWQQDTGLRYLSARATWGDAALRWLPQVLTVIIGLSTGKWHTTVASILLGALPIAWHHWMRRRRAAAHKHNRPAAQPDTNVMPESIDSPTSATAETSRDLPVPPGGSAPSGQAHPGPAGFRGTCCPHWRDQCHRAARSLLPWLPLAKHSAHLVCLSVVMATHLLDALLLGMYVLALLTNSLKLALFAARLASSASARLADPAAADPAAPPAQGFRARVQKMLTRLQKRSAQTHRRCARVATTLEVYLALVSVVGSAAVLFTSNGTAGTLVALMLLAPLAERVAGCQRELEIVIRDTSSVKEIVGEEGQQILQDELIAHGWVQPKGEFIKHVRRQVRRDPELKKYEPALRLICSMHSMIDVLRAVRDPRFLSRLAVFNKKKDGSLHVGGLTRAGFQKLQVGVNYEKITFRERNSARRQVPAGVDTRPTTREVIEDMVARAQAPGFAATNVDAHVLQAAVEYVGRFILSDVTADDQPLPIHKIQMEVRGKTETLNQDSVCRLNISLDFLLWESLGRGGRKPQLCVVGDPENGDFDLPDYGPPTPEDVQVIAQAARMIVSL